MSDSAPFAFKVLSKIVRILRGLLWIHITLLAIILWSDWMEIDLLERLKNGQDVAEGEIESSDARQGLLRIGYLIILIATAIVFMRWTYLSNKNAHALAASEMKFTPGWSVGWYFVPLANLIMPYRVMREMFQASHPEHDADWQTAPRPAIMPLWWGLWLFGSVLGNISGRASWRAESIEEYIYASWSTFVSDAVDIPLTLCALVLVGTLFQWQQEKRRKLNGGNGPDDPFDFTIRRD